MVGADGAGDRSRRSVIRLSIPAALNMADSAEVAAWLRAECNTRSCFLEALDLECQPASRTARLESLTITAAAIEQLSIQVRYRVEFSEFAACQDLTRHAAFERQLIGRIEGNHVVFPEPFRAPVRDAVEEF